ncbi:HAMP domain-containing protein [Cryobacterium sp. 10C3]|uniref:HAMP domain-containing protein n=1 Tax=Cryobacterium sp. 10C3 TaxID=3048577 RepID=UPI002AB3D100|nr:HAMP domain-containing protein [Cryobacterium sp. 10C3]MDY7557476.1 HAMP domain-containing protein [Cryobacterium sp. 10C3]
MAEPTGFARTWRRGWRDWRDWRSWRARLLRTWRSSLQFRTVTITVVLSGIAIVMVGVYVSVSVGNDLFQSRLSQVELDSNRATSAAQGILDSSDAADRVQVQSLLASARSAISAASSSRLVAVFRVPGQDPSTSVPQDFSTFGDSTEVISPELRTAVQGSPGTQFWQSVALATDDDGQVAGIVVGSQITVPVAGRYELYIGYNLGEAETTLQFVQRTLGIAGLLLIILIGAVTWIVVRFVVTPIRVAAETSQRLASGDLGVRLPVKGDDVITTLARSFNGMADSLQSQIKELADLSEVQQRFVSDVSHELRTPLTTIRLAGDMLYDQRAAFPLRRVVLRNSCTPRSSDSNSCSRTCSRSASTTPGRSNSRPSRRTSCTSPQMPSRACGRSPNPRAPGSTSSPREDTSTRRSIPVASAGSCTT